MTVKFTAPAGLDPLATYYLVNLTSDTGASSSATSGDLLWAITQANANTNTHGSVITFDPTVFASAQTILLTSGQLELSDTIGTETIIGPGAGLLSISGNHASRVFQVDGGVTASLSGLTITGGEQAGASGAGLYIQGSLSLTDCTVSGNSAAVGGGLYSYKGRETLTDCTFSDNTASSQGGGLDLYRGAATLTNCTVSGNSSAGGGGLWLQGSSNNTTLTNCLISDNTASSEGGGLLSYSGTSTWTNCTVSANSAGTDGGGLRIAGTATVTNCTISNNSAAGTLSNWQGGGGLWSNGTTIIGNTIVAGNNPTNGNDNGPDVQIIGGVLSSQGHNLIGITDVNVGWVGSGLDGPPHLRARTRGCHWAIMAA